jgi:hypothetical protein
MSCTQGISAAINNDCDYTPKAGTEVILTAFNRGDIATTTVDGSNRNLITAITLESGKQAYTITGFKKSSNSGHDIVVGENLPDLYKQYISIQPWGIDSATVNELDNLSDLVIIVENKNKGVDGDGAFEIYGLETGLYKSSDTRRVNDNNGIQTIEMTTQDGEDSTVSRHVFFDTDYATTAAAVTALLTPAP